MGGKVEKHAFALFKYLMKNAIRSQLWQSSAQDYRNNDIFGL